MDSLAAGMACAADHVGFQFGLRGLDSCFSRLRCFLLLPPSLCFWISKSWATHVLVTCVPLIMISTRFFSLWQAMLFALLLGSSALALPQVSVMDEIVDDLKKLYNATADTATSAAGQVSGQVSTTLGNSTAPAAGAANGTNLVFAHHIVGNTYNYTVSTWTNGASVC